MILDNATVELNFERFVSRVIGTETVFYLSNESGVANSVSNDNEKTVVLMFWSDRAYATRVKSKLSEKYDEQEMELFDFLYRWLPGMSSDSVIAGPNWNGDLVGREIDPFELREKIESKMPNELLDIYESKYNKLTEST